MNLRIFSMAILASALPYSARANTPFQPGDFVSGERISLGEKVVKVKLSKSGKAKLRRLQRGPREPEQG